MPRKNKTSRVSPQENESDALPTGPSQPQPPSIPVTRRQDFAAYYASSTGVFTTTFDLSLIFGKLMTSPEGQVSLEQALQVTMSYQHAKAVADVLAKQVEEYEKANGIVLPFKPVATVS